MAATAGFAELGRLPRSVQVGIPGGFQNNEETRVPPKKKNNGSWRRFKRTQCMLSMCDYCGDFGRHL